MCEDIVDDSSIRSWSEMPASVLTFAFEKLDLRDRAGTVNCIARVCTTWAAAAAAAATRTIDLSWCDNPASLQRWLRSRGSHIVKVELRAGFQMMTILPCPRLQWLVLERITVDLSPGSQLLHDLSAATALEHLHLNSVKFESEFDLEAVLVSMPNLHYLHLGNIKVLGSPMQQQQSHVGTATAVQDSQAVIPTVFWSFPEGPQCNKHISHEGMQFLCKLTQLQALELHCMSNITAAGLASLRNLSGLKRLGLKHLRCGISASETHVFTQLTALTCLELGWNIGEFDPSILAHMVQLEELELYEPDITGGHPGGAELLARLAQLTKLQVLRLAAILHISLCPPVAFSSLTSSSVLRSLAWSDFGEQPGIWQHVFSDGLQLSALTELEAAFGPCWEAPDLDRLISSCSRLQHLSILCTPGLELTALVQLKVLKQLWVRGKIDSCTMASLAQLSGLHRLRRLAVTDPCRCSGSLFVPLTALTQLTYLALPSGSGFCSSMQQHLSRVRGKHLPYHRVYHDVDLYRWPDICSEITSTTPVGNPPNVWSQLLSCCEACDTQATQQHTAAPAVVLEQEQQQQAGLEAAPQQQQNEEDLQEAPLARPGLVRGFRQQRHPQVANL